MGNCSEWTAFRKGKVEIMSSKPFPRRLLNETGQLIDTETDIIEVEARISSDDEQLALGVCLHEDEKSASHISADDSVERKRKSASKKSFLRARITLGKYPFVVVANKLLRDTDPWYAQSTRDERKRKFSRIHKAIQELRVAGKISTTSPMKMTEGDVIQFIGWCIERLDSSTTSKYLRFLDEVLQSVGNGAVKSVRLKRHKNIPHTTAKSIRTVPLEMLDRLEHGDWTLEDEWLEMTAKAAISLYAHTGMRSSEVRLSKLSDLDLNRSVVVVSSPKGHGKWASGTETAPLMPGAEGILKEYLEARAVMLSEKGFNPQSVEALFPHIDKQGRVGFWQAQKWIKLKSYVEQASGVKFKWKDMRATFAMKCLELEVPIEVVSKALRHTNTATTENYYARIRSESAFSRMRQAWEAPVKAKSQTSGLELGQ